MQFILLLAKFWTRKKIFSINYLVFGILLHYWKHFLFVFIKLGFVHSLKYKLWQIFSTPMHFTELITKKKFIFYISKNPSNVGLYFWIFWHRYLCFGFFYWNEFSKQQENIYKAQNFFTLYFSAFFTLFWGKILFFLLLFEVHGSIEPNNFLTIKFVVRWIPEVKKNRRENTQQNETCLLGYFGYIYFCLLTSSNEKTFYFYLMLFECWFQYQKHTKQKKNTKLIVNDLLHFWSRELHFTRNKL